MRNNAFLTTQLSDAMQFNLDMDKKLNLNPTQYPKENKLADKEKIKAAL